MSFLFYSKEVIRKTGYIALSLYLLLVSLAATIPNMLVPSTLMAILAFIAALFIFIDTITSSKD